MARDGRGEPKRIRRGVCGGRGAVSGRVREGGGAAGPARSDDRGDRTADQRGAGVWPCPCEPTMCMRAERDPYRLRVHGLNSACARQLFKIECEAMIGESADAECAIPELLEMIEVRSPPSCSLPHLHAASRTRVVPIESFRSPGGYGMPRPARARLLRAQGRARAQAVRARGAPRYRPDIAEMYRRDNTVEMCRGNAISS